MKNILLVDDNEALLFAFKRISALQNFAVETACSPEEAMRLVSSRLYDILITDLNMTGVNTHEGYDIVKAAKRFNPNIRAFIWTAYDGTLVRAEASLIGVEGFLAKPVTFEALLSKIDINAPIKVVQS